MAFNRTHARKLCTDAEYELFLASLGDAVRELPRARLVQKIKRARALRDKSQDLLRRQRLASRERSGVKDGKGGAANRRTGQKLALFSETLERFENRLAQVDAAAARVKKKRAAPTPMQVKPAKAPKQKAGFQSKEAKGAVHDRRQMNANLKSIQAHVSSRGRRDQAKRDRR